MFKVLFIIGIIAILGWLGISFLATCGNGDISEASKSMPDTRYLVQTPSRAYLTNNYVRNGDTIILRGYHVFTGKKWLFVDGHLTITPNFGKVTIRER